MTHFPVFYSCNTNRITPTGNDAFPMFYSVNRITPTVNDVFICSISMYTLVFRQQYFGLFFIHATSKNTSVHKGILAMLSDSTLSAVHSPVTSLSSPTLPPVSAAPTLGADAASI